MKFVLERTFALLVVCTCVGATGAVAVERPVPRPALLERIREGVELIGIVHWGVNTYTDRGWGFGDEDPALLAPGGFDAEQIVRTAKEGGLQGLVVVAKHHDGLCLWPTKTTEHNITKTPFRNGKGDYVREMSDACRKYGLRFGVYCSPWDRNNADYGTERYVETFHAQIKELLDGRYGAIFEMWFDNANGGDGYYGGARETRKIPSGYYRFDEVFRFVREMQPSVCIFNEDDGADFRWPGNEMGALSNDCRATSAHFDISHYDDYMKWTGRGVVEGVCFHPPEADFPLRDEWFYHESEKGTAKSAACLMQRYLNTVGNGGTMNIGLAPDKIGVICEEDSAALRRFGEMYRLFFANKVDVGKCNVVVMREDVAQGERVDGWKLTVGGRVLLAGQSIGIKRIRILPEPVEVRDIRLETIGNDVKTLPMEFYMVDAGLLQEIKAATSKIGETATAKQMNAARAAAEGDHPVSGNVAGHENTEWSEAYDFNVTDDGRELPRVLLIGDSITYGYNEDLRKLLAGKRSVSYWVSSYCVTRPIYRELLDLALDRFEYEVIHVNNGLHSLDTNLDAWSKAFESMLAHIRWRQPKARIVVATSTPVRGGAKADHVRRINARAKSIAGKLGGIEVNDLFSAMDHLDRERDWADIFHFNAEAKVVQAARVAEFCTGKTRVVKPEDSAPGGVVVLANAKGKAVISVVGATVLSYVPAGGADAFFRVDGFCAENKAFPHGGMPIAWPWFGRKNGTNVEEELHGFVRTLPWKVVEKTDSMVVFELVSDAATRTMFDRDFRLTNTIELGDRLSVAFRIENTDSREMKIKTGFHPFFRVSDNAKLLVHGLEGISTVPVGADNAYVQKSEDMELVDEGLGRKIVIGSTGGDLVNVWNDYSQWMKIYARGGEREFCCVEPMLLGERCDGVAIAPGASRLLTISIGVLPLDRRIPLCNAEVCPGYGDNFVWENDKFGMFAYGPREYHRWSGLDVFNKSNPRASCCGWLNDPRYNDFNVHPNFHDDRGEGMDNYTMGAGRGVGGVGMFIDGEWKTYTSWDNARVIHVGDDYCEFELEYPSYSCLGRMRYHITLKGGENFYRNDVSFSGFEEGEGICIGPGLDVNPKRGHVGSLVEKPGSISLFEEPKGGDGSAMSAVFVAPDDEEAVKVMTDLHGCRVLAFRKTKFTYWAGASWSKADAFTTPEQWHTHVDAFRKTLVSKKNREVR